MQKYQSVTSWLGHDLACSLLYRHSMGRKWHKDTQNLGEGLYKTLHSHANSQQGTKAFRGSHSHLEMGPPVL